MRDILSLTLHSKVAPRYPSSSRRCGGSCLVVDPSSVNLPSPNKVAVVSGASFLEATRVRSTWGNWMGALRGDYAAFGY
jgi:hypothetical protein